MRHRLSPSAARCWCPQRRSWPRDRAEATRDVSRGLGIAVAAALVHHVLLILSTRARLTIETESFGRPDSRSLNVGAARRAGEPQVGRERACHHRRDASRDRRLGRCFDERMAAAWAGAICLVRVWLPGLTTLHASQSGTMHARAWKEPAARADAATPRSRASCACPGAKEQVPSASRRCGAVGCYQAG